MIPLKKFENPPELQCLGFNLTDIHVKINKGYIQANGAYTRLTPEQVDQKFCTTFEERVSKSPAAVFKKLAKSPLFDNPVVGKLFEGDKKKENKQEEL